ncbi:MAG TPA: hypothetical protein VFE47_03320 [Tepidisphaeraceae bacterium]|nr:hypothetical protein [Tepidisphaeraceae bacterium]
MKEAPTLLAADKFKNDFDSALVWPVEQALNVIGGYRCCNRRV